MKKVIYILILAIFFISNVKAFDIDIDKIELDSKSTKLTNNLNKKYNIDITGFDNKIIVDEDVYNLSLEVAKLSLSDDTFQMKKSKFTKYMLLSDTNGADTLTSNLFIEMYLKKLDEYKVRASYIKDIKTVTFNQNDAMSFVYLPKSKVNNKTKDVILVFWLKQNKGEYKVYYPWISIDDDLEAYFNKVTKNEDKGNVIGGTYNQVSLTGSGNVAVSDDVLKRLYQNNQDSVVQLTGMNETGSNSYGSGFFIREGVVVTTWSLFLQFLTNSNYIYVNDCNGNTYEVLGVIAAQVDYDVVVLKINKNAGKGVLFGSSNNLKTDDKLFMINSKNNSGFSISYGSFISLEKGRMKNMFLLSKSDVGSALFNQNGQVVGINVADQLSSELSYANSTDYLKNLQKVLNKQDYCSITYTLLETFKQNYYSSYNAEREYNKISSDVWEKHKEVSDVKTLITIPLIKATYKDEIISLRYKNNTSNMLDSMFLVSSYTDSLIRKGYKLSYVSQNKRIYKNNKYKIVIKNSLNYLIILIMEN